MPAPDLARHRKTGPKNRRRSGTAPAATADAAVGQTGPDGVGVDPQHGHADDLAGRPSPGDARPLRRRVPRRCRWRLALISTTVSVAVATAVLVATHRSVQQTFTVTAPTLPAASGPSGPAPMFSLPDLRSPTKTISLAQYRGRPIVVNFWGSWCPPCRTEMPAFAQVARQTMGSVVFLGIDEEDSRTAALAFAAKTGVGYPLAADQATLTARYRVVGYPTTVIIGATGHILANHPGPLSAANLRRLLRTLAPPPR